MLMTGVYPERNSRALLVVLIALSAFLVFSGTLGHELVWDDESFIRYSRELVDLGGINALATAEFKPDLTEDYGPGYYRPVSLASLWFDQHVGGSSPWVFHLTNTLLHTLCSVLVLVLLLMVLPSRAGAVGGALLFALHPIHVESVAFVSGRTDLLAAVFSLTAAVLWLKLRQGKSPRPLYDWVLYSIAFALACLSKEVAFVLPVVLIVWDFLLPSGTFSGPETFWRRKVWFLVSVSIIGGIVLLRYFALDIEFGQEPLKGSDGLHVPLKVPGILLVYSRLLFLPLAERFLYLPSVGFCLLVGAAWGAGTTANAKRSCRSSQASCSSRCPPLAPSPMPEYGKTT